MENILTTGSGAIWDLERSVRTSLNISVNGTNHAGYLTGKFEDHLIQDETVTMLEVSHDLGTDFIFEQFLSQ